MLGLKLNHVSKRGHNMKYTVISDYAVMVQLYITGLKKYSALLFYDLCMLQLQYIPVQISLILCALVMLHDATNPFHHWINLGSALIQVMAWCLVAQRHYQNQCWLLNLDLRKFESEYDFLENVICKILSIFPAANKSIPCIWHLCLTGFLYVWNYQRVSLACSTASIVFSYNIPYVLCPQKGR